jgi:hypothetical protein
MAGTNDIDSVVIFENYFVNRSHQLQLFDNIHEGRLRKLIWISPHDLSVDGWQTMIPQHLCQQVHQVHNDFFSKYGDI